MRHKTKKLIINVHSFFWHFGQRPTRNIQYLCKTVFVCFEKAALDPFRAPTEDLVSTFFAPLRIIRWRKTFCGKHDA